MADLSSASGYLVKSTPPQLANAAVQVHVGDSMPALKSPRTRGIRGATTFTSTTPCDAAPRTGELHAIALDARKASSEKDLGWKAAVDLVEGIERPIQWLRTILKPVPGWRRAA
jgi:hypothetical protein